MTVYRYKPTDTLVTTEQYKLWPQILDGDVVELESGNYAWTQIYALPRKNVTVRPAPDAQVTFQNDRGYLSIQNSPGWTFQGPMTFQQVSIGGSDDVQFLGTIHPAGVAIATSKRVIVDGCSFVGGGLSFRKDCNGLRIRNNRFRGMTGDAITGITSDVIIEGNDLSDFGGTTLLHADAIQIQEVGQNGGVQPTDIIIRFNKITKGSGQPVQGVFAQCGYRIQIYGNYVMIGNYHGITCSGVEADVHDNYVGGFIGVIDPPKYDQLIAAGQTPEKARASAQMVPWISVPADAKPGNNIVAPLAAMDDYSAADAWWAKLDRSAVIASPPPPIPVPPVSPPPPIVQPVPSLPDFLVEIEARLEKARLEINALKNGAGRALYAVDRAEEALKAK